MRWGHKFPTWMRSLLPRRSLGQLDGIWPKTESFGSKPIDLWGSSHPSLEKAFVLHFRSCSYQLSKSQVVWLQSSSLQQLVRGSKVNQSIHHWLLVVLQLQSWFHQTSRKTRFPLSQPPYKFLEMQTHSKHPDDTNGCSDPRRSIIPSSMSSSSSSPLKSTSMVSSSSKFPAAGTSSTSAGTLSRRDGAGTAGMSSKTPSSTWGSHSKTSLGSTKGGATFGSLGFTPLNKGQTELTSYCTPSRALKECPLMTSRLPFASWFSAKAKTPPPVTYLMPR